MTRALTVRRPRRMSPQAVNDLATVAAALSPAMARVLEKVVAAQLTGTPLALGPVEESMLRVAGAALSVVNRTPGSAARIGRHAAFAVSSNPYAAALLAAAETVTRPQIEGRATV